MEVAFELWTEQMGCILVDFNGSFHRYQERDIGNLYLDECRRNSEFRWYHGEYTRPKRELKAVFLSYNCMYTAKQ